MRSFTDVFIRHPVLAVVVNLVLVLVGWRALNTLPVQQYPKIEISSVLITTVYTGASAETVRGFLTTPIERVVSAISGVDYLESTSRAGVSTITVRLKLNHSSTAALAEITARLSRSAPNCPRRPSRRWSRCNAPTGRTRRSTSASPPRSGACRR
jgi:multidrug efflux pump